MVEAINSWAQKIIIVVIICTIIEMILPEGKNKKYIKTVIGIYVVFTIISPIISNLSESSLNINEHFKTDNSVVIETNTTIDTNEYIQKVYKEKLKTDIKTKIEAINYTAKNINLEIESEDKETYGTILKLSLSVYKTKPEEAENSIHIETIIIGETKNEKSIISDKEKEEIQQYLAEIYYIDKDSITVN